jgi:single-strand DNA-binding protein
MNKVIITGRITKDPELKYTQNGLPNLRFTIACDRVQRDASGSSS